MDKAIYMTGSDPEIDKIISDMGEVQHMVTERMSFIKKQEENLIKDANLQAEDLWNKVRVLLDRKGLTPKGLKNMRTYYDQNLGVIIMHIHDEGCGASKLPKGLIKFLKGFKDD